MKCFAPAARALIQGSELRFNSGVGGKGVADARKLWSELCSRTACSPQLLALPWVFVQSNTCKQQESSLMLHAEKKALAMLLACGDVGMDVSIEFNACMDCHEFYKSSALLLRRSIQLHQPTMVHMVTDGFCSCKDRWRWEARLILAPQLKAL